jgi:ribosomal subunit interface protein
VTSAPEHQHEPARPTPDPVDIVGHGFTVSAQDRAHVIDRLGHVSRYSGDVDRYEVGVFHEANPHQTRTSCRVEITGRGSGDSVRAHAGGPEFHAAFAVAVAKLQARLRRRRDRHQSAQQGTGHQDPVVDTTA